MINGNTRKKDPNNLMALSLTKFFNVHVSRESIVKYPERRNMPFSTNHHIKKYMIVGMYENES